MIKIQILTLAIAACFSCTGQDQGIPDTVKKTFTEMYSTATDIEWENEDGEYEVEFKLNSSESAANFDKNGNWLETETEMKVKGLDNNIVSAITKLFPNAKIKEVEMIETPDMKGYEIQIKNGKGKIEIVLDQSGKVISQKSDEEKDEDEDEGQH